MDKLLRRNQYTKEKIVYHSRQCEKCQDDILLAHPVFMYVRPSQRGENHLTDNVVKFWHRECMSIGELLGIGVKPQRRKKCVPSTA